ncbi:MAG: tRNA (N(6)-L-threonylcarbamoyladenosine(37)-C(2))-methylthiotransferase MtaB [Clostridiales bacterium]|nr:tRNA (N(6)-L-threonylcarbamoyladenosine(37)-C(2))-methylthiotransferase MtaB [Clostridiales bacterium]
MKIYYYTFGCKVNQYETENLKQLFLKRGFDTSDKIIGADVCLVNTCTVTANSDSKCRQFLRKVKKQNPYCILILTGCFPQAFEDAAYEMEECDIITGSSNKTEIPELLDEYLSKRQRIIKIVPHKKGEKFEDMSNTEVKTKTRAYIKIQDGCDQYCSYCIIPYARGHIRSKSLDILKNEIIELSKSGHKEVILVGINLCCYGKDLDNDIRLIDAIEVACGIDGIERVRLGSLEPEMILDEDIKRMARQKKLCPHFHLSLQSGCDRTLKSMNRKYTISEYTELVNKLRENFENCAITTDIMVGFPDETDEDFNQSLEFARKIKFSHAHIFPYSQREGTVAAKRDNQISQSIKEKRARKMTEICKQSEQDFLQKMIGKSVKVLFERESCTEFHQGFSENYTQIKIMRENPLKSLRRTIFCVKIIGYENNYCIGTIIK